MKMSNSHQQPKVQVAGTNDYSIHSKASIVAKGYADDPYLHWFVGEESMKKVRRAPIINRGYYVRHRALEFGFRKVLSNSSTKKDIVISLGAGFDTSALRYHDQVALFIELDYPAVCGRKEAILESRKSELPFQCQTEEVVFENASNSNGRFVTSPQYLLLGVDLRQPEQVMKKLEDEKVSEVLLKVTDVNSSDINIIFLNECSLCYIAREDADALLARLISYLTKKLSNSLMNNLAFTYLGYEMLASSTNTEDYGHFLQRHFDAMGASVLTFISEAEITERFDKLNFEHLEIVNMKTFWREVLNGDAKERERVRALRDPFDEYEELDSVCASYCLTIARKEARFQDCKSRTGLSPSEEKFLPSSFLSPVSQHDHLLSVFGHCSHFDAEKGLLQIFGGFGRDPDIKVTAGHRRFQRIVEFQLSSQDKSSKPTFSTPRLLNPSPNYASSFPQAINRVHAQVVHLGTNRYLLSGGRTSPVTVQESVLIDIDEAEYRLHPVSSINRIVEHQGLTITAQAFRHVCARFGEQIIQFGGITISGGNPVLNGAVFLFDINSSFDETTSTVNAVRRLDTHRHSAAFTSFGEHCLLLNGGLDLATDDFQRRFALLELIDQREMVVNQLKLKTSNGDGLPLLYGHRMQMINEHEVLIVGGIGSERIENAAFQIDLRAPAFTAKYRLQCMPQSQSLLMLQYHTTALTADGRLCIIGGGGNCFSFGTHFNPVLEYDLPASF